MRVFGIIIVKRRCIVTEAMSQYIYRNPGFGLFEGLD